MATRGSIRDALTGLIAVAYQIATDVAAAGGALNVYGWWEPNVQAPALWHWLDPGVTRWRDTCADVDELPFVVTVANPPRPSEGQTALDLADLADLARPRYAEAARARPSLGGAAEAIHRRGVRLASRPLGDQTAVVLEMPIQVDLIVQP